MIPIPPFLAPSCFRRRSSGSPRSAPPVFAPRLSGRRGALSLSRVDSCQLQQRHATVLQGRHGFTPTADRICQHSSLHSPAPAVLQAPHHLPTLSASSMLTQPDLPRSHPRSRTLRTQRCGQRHEAPEPSRRRRRRTTRRRPSVPVSSGATGLGRAGSCAGGACGNERGRGWWLAVCQIKLIC